MAKIFKEKDIAASLKITLWERFLLLFCKKQRTFFKGVKGSPDGYLVSKTLFGRIYVVQVEEIS